MPHPSPAPRRALPRVAIAAACAAATLLIASGAASASGPYVFCDRDYPAYDQCVGGNAYALVETQARDLNGSNWVCATQKNGSSPSSANQYTYACAYYLAGQTNPYSLTGNPAVQNGEGWSQVMRGQFYLP